MTQAHMVAAFLLGMALLIMGVIGLRLVNTPDAQQTPLITTLLGFLTVLASQIWQQSRTDAKLTKLEAKADVAAEKAGSAAAMSSLAAEMAATSAKAGGAP
jgi:hypothetical protein